MDNIWVIQDIKILFHSWPIVNHGESPRQIAYSRARQHPGASVRPGCGEFDVRRCSCALLRQSEPWLLGPEGHVAPPEGSDSLQKAGFASPLRWPHPEEPRRQCRPDFQGNSR